MTNNVHPFILMATVIALIIMLFCIFQSIINIDVFIIYHYCPTKGS